MPHETARKRIVVYLTPEKHTELKTFCAKLKISMSWFVDLAIKDKVRKEEEKFNERTYQKMNISEQGYVTFDKEKK